VGVPVFKKSKKALGETRGNIGRYSNHDTNYNSKHSPVIIKPMNSAQSKETMLGKLEKELSLDEAIPLRASNLVFGEGNSDADVIFVGEAPGYYEDKEGRPFVGRSGKLLDKLIDEIRWKRRDVYITNVVKRRPPENRDPELDEIAAYAPYLSKQIDIINPRVIAPLGRFAMNYFLPSATISKDQGKLFWWGDRLVIPLYHPAAALRSTKVLENLKISFARLPIALKKFDTFLENREPGASTDAPQQASLF